VPDHLGQATEGRKKRHGTERDDPDRFDVIAGLFCGTAMAGCTNENKQKAGTAKSTRGPLSAFGLALVYLSTKRSQSEMPIGYDCGDYRCRNTVM
jgi:hypothetical protein